MAQINVLDEWLARESELQALLQIGPGPGVATMGQIQGKSGFEIMNAMLQGQAPYAAIAKTLNFLMVEAEPGLAVFQGSPGAEHLNPMGTVHGGWFATLLDSALGCAVHTLMPPGRAYTTAELSIKIVRAITPKVQRVRAIGKVLHCGRQLATADAQLIGPDGTLYAHASSACLVFDMPSPKT